MPYRLMGLIHISMHAFLKKKKGSRLLPADDDVCASLCVSAETSKQLSDTHGPRWMNPSAFKQPLGISYDPSSCNFSITVVFGAILASF